MNEKEKHTMTWIIARAWEIMTQAEIPQSEIDDWKSYTKQHAPDVFEAWGSMMK